MNIKRIVTFLNLILLIVFTSVFVYASVDKDENLIVDSVQNLHQMDTTANSVMLSWDESKEADAYYVFKYNNKKDKYENIASVDSTNYTVDKLSSATKYKVYVIAVRINEDYSTTESTKSDVITIYTSPKAPQKIQSTDIGYNSISLSWPSVDGARGYAVYVYDYNSDNFKKVAATDHPFYTIKKLKRNSIHDIRIKAYLKNEDVTLYSDFSEDFYEFTNTSSIPKTNSQIAKRFNDCISSLKSKSNYTLIYKKKIDTKAEYTSKVSLLSTLKNLLKMFNGSQKTIYKFSNGRSSVGSVGQVIKACKSGVKLNGSDIKSFDFSNDGKVSEITITLKKDSSSFNGKDKYISKAPIIDKIASQVNITTVKLTPLKLISGRQTYNNNTVYFKYNVSNNSIIELKTRLKSDVEARCKVSSLKFDASASYTVNESYLIS